MVIDFKRSPDRDHFIIENRLAVRPQDLQADPFAS